MKVGDTVAVNIGASTVANAKIVELGDGTATLVIPATKVVMAVRTELDTTPVAPSQGNEHAILGIETRENQVTPAEVSPANLVETPIVPADGVTPAQASAPDVAQTSAPAPVATPEPDTAGVNEVTQTAPVVETTPNA